MMPKFQDPTPPSSHQNPFDSQPPPKHSLAIQMLSTNMLMSNGDQLQPRRLCQYKYIEGENEVMMLTSDLNFISYRNQY